MEIDKTSKGETVTLGLSDYAQEKLGKVKRTEPADHLLQEEEYRKYCETL